MSTPKSKSNGNVNLRERLRKATVKGTLYEVPVWGEKVELRSMTIAEKDSLGKESEDTFIARVLTLTCFDPDTGEPVFGPDDAEWIAEQPAAAVEPLMLEALKASGVSEDQMTKALSEGKDDS